MPARLWVGSRVARALACAGIACHGLRVFALPLPWLVAWVSHVPWSGVMARPVALSVSAVCHRGCVLLGFLRLRSAGHPFVPGAGAHALLRLS